MSTVCAALQRLEYQAAAEEVRAARALFLSGHVTVAVAGEFKQGKSTLCGALVQDPGLFPTDVDIATNLVTSVEYADQERITVFTDATGQGVGQVIQRGSIPDYVTEQGNPGNALGARLLRVETPLPALRNGLVLLDTPGAGGLNSGHTAVTYAILGSADVVLFVVNAMAPLTVAELSMLSTVAGLGARLLVAVTKADLVVDVDVPVANAMAKLAGVLGPEAAGRIPVIPVSSAAKLDWLRSGDAESLAVSNFELLDRTLQDLLGAHGGAMLVSRALGRTVRSLDDVTAPLRAELTTAAGTESTVREAGAELSRQRDRLIALAAPEAGWRVALFSQLNDIRDRAEDDLRGRLDTVSAGVDEQLAGKDVLSRAQALLAGLERDVMLAWSRQLREVRSEVAAVADRLEETTGLRLNPVLPKSGSIAAFDSFGRRDRSLDQDRRGGLEYLGWVGEVISIFAGDLSAFIAGKLLSVLGSRSGAARKRREEFAGDVRDQLGRAGRELQTQLGEFLDATEQAIVSSYEALITEGHGRVESAGRAIQDGAPDAARAAYLRDALAELEQLRARAVDLVSRASGADARVAT